MPLGGGEKTWYNKVMTRSGFPFSRGERLVGDVVFPRGDSSLMLVELLRVLAGLVAFPWRRRLVQQPVGSQIGIGAAGETGD